MNYLDLFSGIGGFRLGAEWAGLEFENEFHSDIDDYANKVYAKHFPDSIPLGDITKIKSEDLLKYGKDWIITGGFPCQDISIAGKGSGITGTRSGLWSEYWRLIRGIRPRIAIIENVPALTFRGLDRVLADLAKIGYDAEWQNISAAEVGAWHKRERIWIVAYPGCRDSRECSHTDKVPDEWDSKEKSANTPCGSSDKISNSKRIRCDLWRLEGEGIQRENETCHEIDSSCKNVPNSKGSKCKRSRDTRSRRDGFTNSRIEELQKEGYTKEQIRREIEPWSTEPKLGRLAHGIPNRVDRLKCLGNSIVPQIAYLLFNNLIQRNIINAK